MINKIIQFYKNRKIKRQIRDKNRCLTFIALHMLRYCKNDPEWIFLYQYFHAVKNENPEKIYRKNIEKHILIVLNNLKEKI